MKENNFFVVFIGTSSAKTSLKRFHSSLLVKSQSFNLLIDCGDGISKALLAQGISVDVIDGILFSHLHPDHSAGFASLIVQMKQLKRTKKLKIFCHKNLVEALRTFLYQSLVFTVRSSFELEYCAFEHNKELVLAEHFNFISKQNSHFDEYVDYLERKKTSFASSSFLLKLGQKKVFYSGDISSEDLYLFEKENPEVIITEAAHVSWEDILEYYKRMKPNKIYLTHYSDELGKELKQKVKNLAELLKRNIMMANDGFCLKL